MAGLTRVPAPKSPFDGRSAVFGGLLVVVIVSLAIEPWGSTRTPADPTPSPYRAPSAIPAPPAGRTAVVPLAIRPYRPEAFGSPPSGAEWAVRTSTARVTPLPAMGLADPTDIASGPVVDLGPASDLDVIVISGPPGAAVDTIRLWRFDERGRPERQDLARLAAPWADVAAWAVGLRAPGAPAGRVAAWQSGLYRLDLLIEPAGRIRMVMLSVRGDGDDGERGSGVARLPGDRELVDLDAVGASILGRLPQAANLWTVGEILTGWARPPAAGDCRVAQIWRARSPDAGCWPVPIGPTSALGVNLPAGQRVATIELAQVDPLPGPVELESRIGVGGRPGVAALETPAGGLADGIYRITVAIVGGVDEHWYVEVGPDGRRAAEINAFVTNAQR
jgi:hypothetical protein